MRIVKDPDERKQEILDAAIRVFARKGYEKTSISDIANEIGISQGLCYRYFPSKEAIYDAALEEYAQFIADTNMKKTQIKGLPLREQIACISRNMRDYAMTERGQAELYELFHRPESRKLHNELFLKVAQRLVPYVTGILTEAEMRGEIQLENPEAMAYFCVFGQVGILMSEQYSEQEKTEHIKHCLLEMLHLI